MSSRSYDGGSKERGRDDRGPGGGRGRGDRRDLGSQGGRGDGERVDTRGVLGTKAGHDGGRGGIGVGAQGDRGDGRGVREGRGERWPQGDRGDLDRGERGVRDNHGGESAFVSGEGLGEREGSDSSGKRKRDWKYEHNKKRRSVQY